MIYRKHIMTKDRYLLVLKMIISAMETTPNPSREKIITNTLEFGRRYYVKPNEVLKVLETTPLTMILKE